MAPPAQARDENPLPERLDAPRKAEREVHAQDSASEVSDAQDAESHDLERDAQTEAEPKAEAQEPTVDAKGIEPAFTEAESPEAPLPEKNLAEKNFTDGEVEEAEGRETALEDEAVPGEAVPGEAVPGEEAATAEEWPAVADDLSEESPREESPREESPPGESPREEPLSEEPSPEEPVMPRSRAVAMHVRGDGHLADDPEETDSGEGEPSHGPSVPEAEAARKKEAGSHQEEEEAASTQPPSPNADAVTAASEEPVDLLWPDDEVAPALPASAFQVIGQDEFPADAWPHPSTWAIPGTSWEELNEPIAKETDVEAEDER